MEEASGAQEGVSSSEGAPMGAIVGGAIAALVTVAALVVCIMLRLRSQGNLPVRASAPPPCCSSS